MNIICTDRWYSQYPPGHCFLLLLGLLAGAPWLVNPLLGSASLVVLFLLARSCYPDARVATLSVVFFLFSPFFLFMAASHMNHTSAMFFMLLFFLGVVRTFERPGWASAVMAGAALGCALNIRPATAAVMGLPWCVYLLVRTLRRPRAFAPRLIGFMLGAGVLLAVLLTYNYQTNGHPLQFGYNVKYNVSGFLGSAHLGPPHTLRGGLKNTSNNLTALNRYLFEWPFPSLAFVFALLLPGMQRNRWDLLFMLSVLLLAVFYFFYYYQDLCFGPRFFFSPAPLLVLLTVRCLLQLPGRMARLGYDRRAVRAVVCLFVCCCFGYTLAVSMPRLYAKYSDFYWHVDNALYKAVTAAGIANAVVFVDVMVPPETDVPNLPVYGAGFLHNEPDLRGPVVYAVDRGQRNPELMRAYPDRSYYLWKYEPGPQRFRLVPLPGPTSAVSAPR
ncbi:ArnT family glycosyltransferase, partial [Thermodesulfobacteriota bacterium]